MKLSRSTKICASALVLAAAAGAQAHAQSAPARPTNPDDQVTTVDEIVVTARKREESLQDVPASIQVVSQTQINALNATSLSDLNGATPGARVDPNSGNITIRGISSSARNAGFEAGSAVYIDGVYQGRPLGNNQNLVDIARVEVLRGPQGTLFGKNTTAGAFNLTTVSPGDTWRGRAFVRVGNRDERNFTGYVAGSLIADTLGLKISAFSSERNGYQRDLNLGYEYGTVDTQGARGELRLTTAGWDVALRGDYTQDDSRIIRPEPVVGGAVVQPGMDTIASNVDQPRPSEGGGASLTVEREVSLGTVTSITAWRKLDSLNIQDDDFGIGSAGFSNVTHVWTDGSRQFSQELRLTSPGSERLSYVLGLYYFDQTIDSDRPFTIGGVERFFLNTSKVETTSYAAFANLDFHFNDRLTVTGGLRYTREDKHLDFIQKGLPPLGYPAVPQSSDEFEDDDLSPALSVRYEFTPRLMTYLTISRGFKAGGWNPEITKQTSVAGIRFDSEQNTNYEAGVRAQLFDRRLTLNTTIYHMAYKDLQVSQFVGAGGFVIGNAGQAEINGIEFDASARPSEWLTLNAGAAYTDAQYTEFLSGTGADYSGQQLTNVPERSAYVSADVEFPVSASWNLVGHVDYRYESEVFFDDARTQSAAGPFARDGYGLANARVGLVSQNGIEISAFVDNLSDERTLMSRSTDFLGFGYVLDAYRAPRQYGVRLGYTF